IGFRGGIYEGVQPTSAATGPNYSNYPAFGGFVNFDIIGSEEGSYLYQSVYFAKDPILSISLAGTYQAQALRTLKGLTNQRGLTSTLFLDFPLSEELEFGAILGGYLYGNGTGSRDTGKGVSLDVGYRIWFVRPYVSLEYFQGDDCTPGSDVTLAQCAQAHTGDSRNARFGLAFYINKAQNHVV